MRTKLAVSMAGLLLMSAAPVLAHHSFAAEFDNTKRVTLSGTVTKLDWLNPHIWIYLDVKDESGKAAKWQCEGGPPNSLTRNGWTKDALKAGDQITIEGARAKDATNTCSSTTIKLPDGRKLFSGSAESEAAK